jgi:hypothetical protein
MKNTVHKVRHFFCFFSGEDDFIIRRSESIIQFWFSLIGFIVSLLFICFLWSSYLFVSNMFHDEMLGIIISIIVSLVFINLYLLILYTISPPLLPTKKTIKQGVITKHKSQHSSIKSKFIGFSLLLRICILILLALFIAQPFNVLILSDAPDHNEYAREIRDVTQKNYLTLLFNFISCIIFLIPVYCKYLIRNHGRYYVDKQRIEHNLILDNYNDYKKTYSAILTNKIASYHSKVWAELMPYLDKLKKIDKSKYDKLYLEIALAIQTEEIVKYEYWADPPFRTIPKNEMSNLLSEEDFLKTIYPKIK